MPTQGRGPDRPGVDDPGRGRRIGIDVGSVRIGIASSDPDGVLATPVETVPRSKVKGPDAPDVVRVAEIIAEYEAVEVVIGLPRTLRGERGSAVDAAERFGRSLHRRLAGVPIRMADERLTTVSASRALRESGVRAKDQRSVIDQAAAVAILQGWLDERRAAAHRATTNSGSTEVDE
ncbi:putative pre-16S rRNA nuclease [Rhodococcus sp. NKCM2511]|uniref:Putative pre-16S rRNA nuclease n=1 Tax=Rhodococcoides fascians TaxID=1828 RepID=A0A143QQ80_RHOFA|nr:Putative Holliday junction resolvase [Rhodococcus fascians]MDP9636569.1 putative Holliday junction resolvase [Rhodococcus cercidiphylli]NIL85923.1 putative pre-16S rRNA nuclease [Rhodococcus fascians]GHP15548.1 putative pre-16S rRNA nuclease [Rhodococcus sp. NKCM2511]